MAGAKPTAQGNARFAPADAAERETSTRIAKLTPPRMSAVYPRTRLFEQLDAAFAAPVVWIEASPGAGKTTLAASWLAARHSRALWYHVDSRDADVATFFHYLGLAVAHSAPRSKRRLPHLTPEYRLGLDAFARRYFEELFRRLPRGGVLVLDDVQAAGGGGPLHDVLRIAFETIPAHARVLCLSRTAPAPALARLRANGQLAMLGPAALQLTLDETRGLIGARAPRHAAAEEEIHARSGGWAAGVVLMLESGPALPDSPRGARTPQGIFDYFAGEIWKRLDPRPQRALMACAHLPSMPADDADALTGSALASNALRHLHGRGYFTSRLSGARPAYEFHPLFRDFLLARATEELGAAELARIRGDAARLLERAGRIDDAVPLLVDCAEWDAIARLVLTHAPALVVQGRQRTVEGWIRSLPPDAIDRSPWLLHWLGACRMHENPYEGRQHLVRAFEAFKSSGDHRGMLLAWTLIAETILFGWGEKRERWIGEFDALLATLPSFPSPELEARTTVSMFTLLMLWSVHRADLPAWEAKVMAIWTHGRDPRVRYRVAHLLVTYNLWIGDHTKAIAIRESLRPPDGAPEEEPLLHLLWYDIVAQCAWMSADAEACFAAVRSGFELADRSGVHVLDLYYYKYGITAGVSLDHLDVADGLHRRMSALPTASPMHRAFFHYLTALITWRRGDPRKAAADARLASRIMDEMDYRIGPFVCHSAQAIICHDAGEREEAAIALARAREIAAGGSFLEFVTSLHGARLALEQGNDAAADTLLGGAMRLGAKHRFRNFSLWDPPVMSRLCAAALDRGIETEYVRALVRARRLPPPEDEVRSLEAWPWPVELRTFGELEVRRDGEPLRFSGKVQRRPLLLLKLIIAFGGREVPEERLADALWPEAEGDVARQNLRPTIHRLRKLIGAESLTFEGGRIGLDPTRCSVDLWRGERLLDTLGTPAPGFATREPLAAARALRRLLVAAARPFLEADELPVVIGVRDRFRARLVRHASTLAATLLGGGASAEALALCELALRVDPGSTALVALLERSRGARA